MSYQSHLFDPDLDDRIQRAFDLLCVPASPDEVKDLISSVSSHLNTINKAFKKNEFLDVSTAKKISEKLIQLLRDIDSCPIEHQKSIVGASRYFVEDVDTEPDTTSIIGFDDDLAVLNYVLKTIGQSELKAGQ